MTNEPASTSMCWDYRLPPTVPSFMLCWGWGGGWNPGLCALIWVVSLSSFLTSFASAPYFVDPNSKLLPKLVYENYTYKKIYIYIFINIYINIYIF